MKLPGSGSAEDRNKFIAVCAFVVLAAAVLYFELRDPTPASAPAPPVIVTAPCAPGARAPDGHEARKVGTTAAALDPTLHMQPMRNAESVIYEGTGRNIFSAMSAPVVIPKPIVAPRPVATPVNLPVVPSGPPPPPPINLKFCGYFVTSPKGERQVILLQGDDVVLAREGDVVLRRYKILNVSANSIQVEDMANNNKQVLPISSTR